MQLPPKYVYHQGGDVDDRDKEVGHKVDGFSICVHVHRDPDLFGTNNSMC